MSNYESKAKVRLYINNTDVTDSYYNIRIFQSIDSPTWSADIAMLDAKNLTENIPIQHGSEVRISVETQHNVETDDNVEFLFFVYKITDKKLNNQHAESYVLKLVSKPFLENNLIKINERFRVKTTDIIAQIANKSFQDFAVEIGSDCDNLTSCLIPKWNPFTAIAWLLRIAHKAGKADFMFFQNELISFKIDSIQSMYNDSKNRLSPILKYKVSGNDDKKEIDVYNIIKHEYHHVDVQQNIQNGYYASTNASYDFFKKEWKEETVRNEKAGSDNRVSSELNSMISENAESTVITFIPCVADIYGDGIPTPYEESDKWVASRRMSLQELDSEKFSAQTYGSVGMYRWLGKHIMIDLPAFDTTTDDFYSKFRKGYYLTTAIAHFITPSTYICNFEFVKLELN